VSTFSCVSPATHTPAKSPQLFAWSPLANRSGMAKYSISSTNGCRTGSRTRAASSTGSVGITPISSTWVTVS
jgi:hypothetical protein